MTAALASAGVQFGTITIASGNTTGTGAISAMGAGGFLLMAGENASQAGASMAQSSCALSISGTNITATRQTGGANTVTVPFIAVDGDTTNFIKSVQYGSVSFVGGSSTGNATITSVTTGNTAVAHLGMFGTSTSVSLNLSWPIWALASATSVSMTTNTSGGVLTGNFCAIEFQSAALVSLQYVADTAAPSVTTRAHTISAVTLANTFSIYAGQWSSSTTPSSQCQYGQLTATTTLTLGTNSAGFVSISYATFIVNLASALVETGTQRGLITRVSQASNTAAISAVNTAHAIATYNGNSTTGANWNNIISSISLTSGTVVTSTAGTTSSGSDSYEVIALNAGATGPVEHMPWLVRKPNTIYPVVRDAQQRQLWTPDNSPQQLAREVEWLGVLHNTIYPSRIDIVQKNLWHSAYSPQEVVKTIDHILQRNTIYPKRVDVPQVNLWNAAYSPQQLPREINWFAAQKNIIYVAPPTVKNPSPWQPAMSFINVDLYWMKKASAAPVVAPAIQNKSLWFDGMTGVITTPAGIEWLAKQKAAAAPAATPMNSSSWFDGFSVAPPPPPPADNLEWMRDNVPFASSANSSVNTLFTTWQPSIDPAPPSTPGVYDWIIPMRRGRR